MGEGSAPVHPLLGGLPGGGTAGTYFSVSLGPRKAGNKSPSRCTHPAPPRGRSDWTHQPPRSPIFLKIKFFLKKGLTGGVLGETGGALEPLHLLLCLCRPVLLVDLQALVLAGEVLHVGRAVRIGDGIR